MNAMEMLDTVFAWVLRTSGEAAVIVPVILAAQTILRNRLKPRWRYALWLVVLARIFMPWAPESSLSIFNLFHTAHLTDPVPYIKVFWAEPAPAPDVSVADAAVPSPAIQGTHPTFGNPRHLLAFLWLLGVTAFAAHVAFENTRFWLRVRKAPVTSEPRVLELLRHCRGLLFVAPKGWGRTIRVVATNAVSSPALFGFLRPRLLLPVALAESYDPKTLRYVFLHELAHLKRYDVLMNWLTTLLQAVHWFNPLLWYAFYRMRIDREPACDALALSCLQPEESGQYGQTILDLLESVYTVRHVPGMAGILEDQSQIKERIMHISLFTRNSYRWSALACFVLAVVASIVLTDATSAESGGTKSPRGYPAFSKAYSLRAGEALKLVSPPFIPERNAIAAEPDGKSTSVFLFDREHCASITSVNEISKNDAGDYTVMSWITLRGFLNLLGGYPSAGYHVPLCDFELPEALATRSIPPGDWVLEPKALEADVLKSLENILRNDWKRDLHFTQTQMERDVIVASGEFTFAPLRDVKDNKTLHFFADTLHGDGAMHGELGGVGGGYVNIQSSLQQYLGMHVFSEIHGERGGIQFEMIPLTPEERQNPETRNRVLENLAKQTALAFRIERRTLPVWVLTETGDKVAFDSPRGMHGKAS